VGMLIIPAATAYLLTDQLHRMIIISMVMGILSSVVGYYVATALDASISGCMVCAAALFFALAFLFSPSHGLISRIWRRKVSFKSI